MLMVISNEPLLIHLHNLETLNSRACSSQNNFTHFPVTTDITITITISASKRSLKTCSHLGELTADHRISIPSSFHFESRFLLLTCFTIFCQLCSAAYLLYQLLMSLLLTFVLYINTLFPLIYLVFIFAFFCILLFIFFS